MAQSSTFYWDQMHSFLCSLLHAERESRRYEGSYGLASWWELKPQTGEGYIEVFDFNDGLKMLILNCRWNSPQVFDVQDGDYVRLNFSLKLDLMMQMVDQTINAQEAAWRLINDAPSSTIQESLSPAADNIWITLVFKESYIEKLLGGNVWQQYDELQVLKKVRGKTIHREFAFDHQLNLVCSQLVSLSVHDDIFCFLAHVKAQELLCLAIDRLISTDSYPEEGKIKLKKSDVKALHLAKDMLLANLEKPMSIKELCSAVGINRNKLHYGFKSEFGATPPQLLESHRLSLAYEALKESRKKIYQIAADVGYTNQGSFATAFKRKYGVTPKEVASNFDSIPKE